MVLVNRNDHLLVHPFHTNASSFHWQKIGFQIWFWIGSWLWSGLHHYSFGLEHSEGLAFLHNHAWVTTSREAVKRLILFFRDFSFGEYYNDSYIAPWVRCQPYVISIATGYLLNYTKNKKIHMNKVKLNKKAEFAFCNR